MSRLARATTRRSRAHARAPLTAALAPATATTAQLGLERMLEQAQQLLAQQRTLTESLEARLAAATGHPHASTRESGRPETMRE